MLYKAPRTYAIIPKRAFGSEEAKAEFRELVRNREIDEFPGMEHNHPYERHRSSSPSLKVPTRKGLQGVFGSGRAGQVDGAARVHRQGP